MKGYADFLIAEMNEGLEFTIEDLIALNNGNGDEKDNYDPKLDLPHYQIPSIDMYTPDNITKLNTNEVFVFGSNLSGFHGSGAARTAMKWGAVLGQGVGIQGQTYAIPTMQGDISSIATYVNEFVEYAKLQPEKLFFVTKIGCGIAGYSILDISLLFKGAYGIINIVLPYEFVQIIMKQSIKNDVKGCFDKI